ncbi:MAG TPA: acetylglutamate kinase [Polyangiaceae bacterium]
MALSSCFVLKIGGEIARSAELAALAGDIVALVRKGHAIVVVHGGGPQVTELQKSLGQTPNVVAGRRITDAAALSAVKMAVAGAVNVDVCSALVRAGGAPVGLHGASSQAIRARKRPPVVVAGGGPDPIDFGHVGDVTGVNQALLELLVGAGHTPVLACLGADESGAVYNINADAVASRVASSLGARALVLVTDVPFVRFDAADETSRVPRMTKGEAESAIREGRIKGGMIPKLTEAFAALEQGVSAVLIVGRLAVGDLARALEAPGEMGTLLTAG